MKKYHFTMILSEQHLFKVIPMYVSLCQHCKSFKLFILCMNDSVYAILSKIGFENIILIPVKYIEDNCIELINAKANRSFHEYCWTLKPIFLYYIMNKYDKAEYYAHVDADLFFFSNIDDIFKENPNASIFLTHHRNSDEFKYYYDLSGTYNTGFVGLKNNNEARIAAKLWGERCLKKCTMEYDVVNKTFGDQRYVEEWFDIFKNIHVVNSIGVNVAFWNIKNYKVSKRYNNVYVDETPLIFYHFSSVVTLGPREFDLCSFFHIDDDKVLQYIYDPYVRLLSNGIEAIMREFPWFNVGFVDRININNCHNYKV